MTKLYMFLFCIHIFQNLKIQALLCLDEFLFLHLTCEEDLLLPEQKPQYYSEDSHPFIWIHALLGRPSVGHPTSPPPLLNPTDSVDDERQLTCAPTRQAASVYAVS